MSDKIQLHQITCNTIVGILDHERQAPQRLVLSVVLEVSSLADVAKSGNLSQGVDYKRLLDFINWYCQSWHFGLLESLAEGLAFALIKQYPQIIDLELCIEKPQALHGAAIPSIQIHRSRSDYTNDHIEITLYSSEHLLITLQQGKFVPQSDSAALSWPISDGQFLEFLEQRP